MKESTKEILKMFPNLKDYEIEEKQEFIKSLNTNERTFLKLISFLENPNKNNFDLQEIYQLTDHNWIKFALDVIKLFFSKDTYLDHKPSNSFITDDNEL